VKGDEGKLVIKSPWPGMTAGIFKDDKRFIDIYWSKYNKQGWYQTGDSAKKDEDGYFWILGRTDDVIKISGYRLGSAEIENMMIQHPAIAESAAIALPHPLKGNCIHVFAILRKGYQASKELEIELIDHVTTNMGPIARPEEITFLEQLPKTRSGKIMRRILTRIAAGNDKDLGDISTLADPSVVDILVKGSK